MALAQLKEKPCSCISIADPKKRPDVIPEEPEEEEVIKPWGRAKSKSSSKPKDKPLYEPELEDDTNLKNRPVFSWEQLGANGQ